MKKSKSIEFVTEDLNSIYNTIFSLSLYEYINSSFFKASKQTLSPEDSKIYNKIRYFENNNNLFNQLTVNLISIMENYLHNILAEHINKEESKSTVFIEKYKFEKPLSPQDVIDGPKALALKTLKGVIYHNLPKINSIFNIVFNLDIINISNSNIKTIFQIIKARHLITHQSSRFEDSKISIKLDTFLKFMNIISDWLLNIDSNILTGSPRKRTVNYRMKFYREISNILNMPILEDGLEDLIQQEFMRVFTTEKDPNKILI